MIEYLPFYQPGTQLVRCLSCCSLVASGDTETHAKWHERIEDGATHLPGQAR